MMDQFLQAAAGDDFIGLQVYTAQRFGPDGLIAPPGRTEQDPGARHGAPSQGARRGDQPRPLLPAPRSRRRSHGIATARRRRPDRLHHTEPAGLSAAIDAGADVRGYVHWSLLDNSKSDARLRATFGLVAVDRRPSPRTPKPSLAWLGEVAKRNGLA